MDTVGEKNPELSLPLPGAHCIIRDSSHPHHGLYSQVEGITAWKVEQPGSLKASSHRPLGGWTWDGLIIGNIFYFTLTLFNLYIPTVP